MKLSYVLLSVALLGCTTDIVESRRSSALASKEVIAEPAPAPEEPTKGDKCDGTFSIDDCKGGKAGETECKFPDGTKGLCWSEGPKNGDEWDCNICKPKTEIVKDTDLESIDEAP